MVAALQLQQLIVPNGHVGVPPPEVDSLRPLEKKEDQDQRDLTSLNWTENTFYVQ
jgi:hypothetical protein